MERFRELLENLWKSYTRSNPGSYRFSKASSINMKIVILFFIFFWFIYWISDNYTSYIYTIWNPNWELFLVKREFGIFYENSREDYFFEKIENNQGKYWKYIKKEFCSHSSRSYCDTVEVDDNKIKTFWEIFEYEKSWYLSYIFLEKYIYLYAWIFWLILVVWIFVRVMKRLRR